MDFLSSLKDHFERQFSLKFLKTPAILIYFYLEFASLILKLMQIIPGGLLKIWRRINAAVNVAKAWRFIHYDRIAPAACIFSAISVNDSDRRDARMLTCKK